MANVLASGHTVEETKGDEAERLKKMYYMYSDGTIKLQPGNWFFPINFQKFANLIYNFEVQSTDTFVVTYPKSGTTWMQEIVWTLLHNPDLNNPEGDLSFNARFPNIESDMYTAVTGAPPFNEEGDAVQRFRELCPGKDPSEGLQLHLAMVATPPRTIKTHVPISLLPSKALENSKIIYIARDPRDVITSLYHYVRLNLLLSFKGTLDELIEDFLNDNAYYAPYWPHLKEAWDIRDHPNLCFVFYEDLCSNIFDEVKRIDKFLGTNRTDNQISNVVSHTDFSSMKERTKDNPPTSNDKIHFNKEIMESGGGFFRKGKTEDWKNNLSPEQQKKMTAWMAKNLPQFGDNFKYKV